MKRLLVMFVLLLEVAFGSDTWIWAYGSDTAETIAVDDANGYTVAYVVDEDNTGYFSVFGSIVIDACGVVGVELFLNVSSIDGDESYDFPVHLTRISDSDYVVTVLDGYNEISDILKRSNNVYVTVFLANGEEMYSTYLTGKGFTKSYNNILN